VIAVRGDFSSPTSNPWTGTLGRALRVAARPPTVFAVRAMGWSPNTHGQGNLVLHPFGSGSENKETANG